MLIKLLIAYMVFWLISRTIFVYKLNPSLESYYIPFDPNKGIDFEGLAITYFPLVFEVISLFAVALLGIVLVACLIAACGVVLVAIPFLLSAAIPIGLAFLIRKVINFFKGNKNEDES